MTRLWLLPLLAAAGLTVSLAGCAEQTSPRVRIDPQADQALHRMSDTLARARSFRVHSETTMDQPLPSGQMAQFSRQAEIHVERPDRMFVRTEQGNDVWMLWYRGTDLTLLDTAGKTYASLKVPGRIDGMLEDVADKHGLTVPLADFLFSNPYKVLTRDALAGKYVGRLDMSGAKCDHLLFTQDALDWQIWIDAGAQPLPRKIVIDYKRLPGRPQFAAVLSDWDLAAAAEAGQFNPVLPKDARQVEPDKLLAEAEGE